MRRFAISCVVFLAVISLCAPVTFGQDSDPQGDDDKNLTHGQFALLMMRVVDTKPGINLTAVEALVEAKRLDLMPQEWLALDILTHGELADTIERFGAHYQPSDRDEPASRAFTEALLRRILGSLKDYLAKRMGHGVSSSHVLDEGVDRAVSPIYVHP